MVSLLSEVGVNLSLEGWLFVDPEVITQTYTHTQITLA